MRRLSIQLTTLLTLTAALSIGCAMKSASEAPYDYAGGEDYAEAKAVSADASYDGYAEAPGEPGGGSYDYAEDIAMDGEETVNPGHIRGCHFAHAVSNDSIGFDTPRLPQPGQRDLQREDGGHQDRCQSQEPGAPHRRAGLVGRLGCTGHAPEFPSEGSCARKSPRRVLRQRLSDDPEKRLGESL